jgi:hypothetical protein
MPCTHRQWASGLQEIDMVLKDILIEDRSLRRVRKSRVNPPNSGTLLTVMSASPVDPIFRFRFQKGSASSMRLEGEIRVKSSWLVKEERFTYLKPR